MSIYSEIEKLPEDMQGPVKRAIPIIQNMAEGEFEALIKCLLNGKYREAAESVVQKQSVEETLEMVMTGAQRIARLQQKYQTQEEQLKDIGEQLLKGIFLIAQAAVQKKL